MNDERDKRQAQVHKLIVNLFGPNAGTRRERATRLLEEAMELAVLEYVHPSTIRRLADYVCARNSDINPAREAGQVAVTLLAYCEARGISAEIAELAELERLRNAPPDEFRAHHKEKIKAGLSIE